MRLWADGEWAGMRWTRPMKRSSLQTPFLYGAEMKWEPLPWPPVTPFHRWIGLHAGTLAGEAAQRERKAAPLSSRASARGQGTQGLGVARRPLRLWTPEAIASPDELSPASRTQKGAVLFHALLLQSFGLRPRRRTVDRDGSIHGAL